MTSYPEAIRATLAQFNVDATIDTAIEGPSVVRYELKLGTGVKVDKISGLQKELAYACASQSVRILAPIPGKAAVGIELPKLRRDTVTLEDVPEFNHPLDFAVGKDIENNMVTGNLGKMPHLLVAGTTGSGKSSFINSMLVSMLKADPDTLQMLMIDPKMVELTPYGGIPHLLQPVVTEAGQAAEALADIVVEMEARYEAMQEAGVRHVDALGLPYIVVVVDELADLVMADKTIEPLLVRVAQKARAAGIHLVLCTQRPSVDVLSGLLKSNIPSRLSFATASWRDSQVILDENGAEQLLGAGDGLYKPIGSREAIRIQGAYVTDQQIDEAVRQARSRGRVEEMVDRLYPEPEEVGLTILDYLNMMIHKAEQGGNRGESYLDRFSKKSLFSSSMRILNDGPQEVGAASDTLYEIAEDLKALRDEALEQASGTIETVGKR